MAKGRGETRSWSMRGGEELMTAPTYTLMHGSERDIELAKETLRLTRELRILIGQYAMLQRLTRDRYFGEACDQSPAKNGLAVLIGALLRTIVVSSAAIFDEDPRTSNIKKIIIRATNKGGLEFLNRLHACKGNTQAFERSRDRLINYRRRINSGKFSQAIARLTHVRRTVVAHFDANPAETPGGQRAVVGDVRYVVAAAIIIVGEANVLILDRQVAYPALREMLREEANGFTSTLMMGFQSMRVISRRSEQMSSGQSVDAESGSPAREAADG